MPCKFLHVAADHPENDVWGYAHTVEYLNITQLHGTGDHRFHTSL